MANTESLPGVSRSVGEMLAEYDTAAPTLNLFPTENRLSPAALRALSSEIVSRYPGYEGYGSLYADPLDLGQLYGRCADLANAYFGSRYAFVNLLSGLHAMQSMLTTVCRPGARVLVMDPEGGGHYATARICDEFGYRVGSVPLDHASLLIDTELLAKRLREEPADFVYLDLSTLLRLPRLDELRAAIGPGTPLCVDASHILGLLPMAYGDTLWDHVDLVSGSTHKTFPGPQKAMLLTSRDDLAASIADTLPYRVSSGHTNSVAALAITLEELMETRVGYGRQVVANARMFARTLADEGFDVAGESFGYTETHQVWIAPGADVPPLEWGYRLLAAGVRSTSVPLPSHGRVGLRLGLQELTRVGGREAAAAAAAGLVAAVIRGDLGPEDGRREVGRLVAGLPGVTSEFLAV